ncbi:hypothetical protein Pcinc_025800 [Petrolisthes cinctipes]|uniref:Uncharacterized protein n=1 Tax=Petrolisthes cinctipes TaxID=88211 RepID=A0AAE1KB82_PETCI|nr:hypothetical protein Pcinc_025800 [Petrolisthes cinctipes]
MPQIGQSPISSPGSILSIKEIIQPTDHANSYSQCGLSTGLPTRISPFYPFPLALPSSLLSPRLCVTILSTTTRRPRMKKMDENGREERNGGHQNMQDPGWSTTPRIVRTRLLLVGRELLKALPGASLDIDHNL